MPAKIFSPEVLIIPCSTSIFANLTMDTQNERRERGVGNRVTINGLLTLSFMYLEFLTAVSHWVIFVMHSSTCLFLSLSETMAT